MTEALIEAPAFDRLSAPAAEILLRPSCASRAWLEAIVAGRPYGSLATLVARSDEVLAGLGWSDLEEALAAHPRIGERPEGAGLESAWSRQEQSGVAQDPDVETALRDGNLEYERRFGHVFLICASGRSSEQLLAGLRDRLGNDAATEREVVRAELSAIVGLRLAKTIR